MSRIVYVNGQYLPEEQATVSIFDRGFIFADGIYEVSAVINGKLVDVDAHLARLERSCAEIRLELPWTRAELIGITTIRQPTYDIGYKAVEFVHERIEGVSGDARVVLLPGTLVERASTVHSTQAAS
jgi:branched-subunit amino acid aminotransferase/4-amino-4-deoxychorismate lyase